MTLTRAAITLASFHQLIFNFNFVAGPWEVLLHARHPCAAHAAACFAWTDL